eukprot:UC4_evm1s254
MNLKIEILDENDNSPTFPGAPFKCSFSEDTAIQSTVCSNFESADADYFPSLSYSLHSEQEYFSLVQEKITGTDTTLVKIQTKRKFDREVKEFYNLDIMVCDNEENDAGCGGLAKRCSNTTIAVTILDINDNPPDLSDVPISTPFEFREDSNLVAVIDGKDIDKGENQEITYSVLKASSDEDRFYFNENILMVKPRIDFDESNDT